VRPLLEIQHKHQPIIQLRRTVETKHIVGKHIIGKHLFRCFHHIGVQRIVRPTHQLEHQRIQPTVVRTLAHLVQRRHIHPQRCVRHFQHVNHRFQQRHVRSTLTNGLPVKRRHQRRLRHVIILALVQHRLHQRFSVLEHHVHLRQRHRLHFERHLVYSALNQVQRVGCPFVPQVRHHQHDLFQVRRQVQTKHPLTVGHCRHVGTLHSHRHHGKRFVGRRIEHHSPAYKDRSHRFPGRNHGSHEQQARQNQQPGPPDGTVNRLIPAIHHDTFLKEYHPVYIQVFHR